MLEKILNIFILDPDVAGGTVAGAVSESLTNKRSTKVAIMHFFRALTIGWMLATFVAPAIAYKLKLKKVESVAVAFVGGYAGVKILSTTEKVLLERIKSKKSSS